MQKLIKFKNKQKSGIHLKLAKPPLNLKILSTKFADTSYICHINSLFVEPRASLVTDSAKKQMCRQIFYYSDLYVKTTEILPIDSTFILDHV